MTILMCSPGDEWQVNYDINPWMPSNIGKVDSKLALEQWTTFRDELAKYTDVVTMNPNCNIKDHPDMVFTANAGYVLDKKIALSHFNSHERSLEEPIWERWFLENGYITIRQSDYPFEGAGDFLNDKWGSHFFGQGVRSSQHAGNFLNVLDSNLKWYPLRLTDPRFYHLDTCFCPIDSFKVLCYPPAINMEDFVRACHGRKLITVTEEEAKQFACNAVSIGKEVFMPKCFSVAEKFSELGFNPHLFDMSEFIKAGGACKCLTLEI